MPGTVPRPPSPAGGAILPPRHCGRSCARRSGGPRTCAKLAPVRHQYWFFYGYRPGLRTVARQLLH